MSMASLLTELRRFVLTPGGEVLCINGKWGVGKTYAWTKFLKEQDATKLAFKRYSYVSLFGLGTMDQVRSAIVESAQPPEQIGKPIELTEIFFGNAKTESLWRRALGLGGYVPLQTLKDLAASIQAASFLAVRQYLICIDDLERKGSSLSVKDILGLIDYLSEQRECKVCLILNDDAFDDQDKKLFEKFFEKTIDSHVVFAPTSQESIDIALPAGVALNDLLRPNCLLLRIANIRVLKKIERCAKVLESSIEDKAILGDALKTVVLLMWSKYNEEAPSLKYLKKRGRDFSTNKEDDPEEKQWGTLLNQYGFRHMQRIDEVLVKGVEDGYFNEAELRKEIAAIQKDVQSKEKAEKFDRAWRRYHDSFNDDAKELVKELCSSFKESVDTVSPVNANGTVRLLKDLGNEREASELIKYYLEKRSPSILDTRTHFSPNDFTEPEFRAAFDAKVAAQIDRRKPEAVLEEMSRRSGWNNEDVALLAKLSSDDFYRIFKNTSGDQLSPMVEVAIGFGGTEQGDRIVQNATAALKKIADESRLNKRRVGKFRIE